MYKKLTSTDLAVICGVSQGTVDRALNNRPGISPKTKQKIMEAAEKYGYFPDIHAGKLAGGKSRLVGVVMFDLKNEYFSELVCAIDANCRKSGYASVTMFSGKDVQTEIACVKRLVSIGVDGLIICAVNEADALKCIIPDLMPVVAVGNRLEGFDFCGADDFSAMKELCRKAAADGYTLVYYSPALKKRGHENISAQELRYRGYCSFMEKMEAPYCICMDEVENCIGNMDEGEKPAVVCSSDFYALQILGRYPALPVYSFDGTRILRLLSAKTVAVGIDAEKVAENALNIICEWEHGDVIIDYSMK